ncbi:MAG: FAD-dependent oxidoreductase [Chitinophagaceae bacterium]
MQIDYLIIGQGICGTFLSWELQKANLSFLVIDEPRPFTASKIASGIINPVTGRRMVKTWMIDELMPFAWNAYKNLGSQLAIDGIAEQEVIDFFPTPQMRLSFSNRLQEDQQYLSLKEHTTDWKTYLNFDFGYGIIHPCFLVNLAVLLHRYRKQLMDYNQLREECFEPSYLKLQEKGIRYKDIDAGKIILCDGINSFRTPFFKNLPFAPNKGEALIVEINDFPANAILKKGLNVVPWKDNLFWVGSSHEWKYEDDQPTAYFRTKTLDYLKLFIKAPIRLQDHWSAVRPATLERRPFIGFHPVFPNLGIFNGMGTKGCSLAPFFASHLVQHLTLQTPILPEAGIERFKRILARTDV